MSQRWSRHYNWQFLRRNEKYQTDFNSLVNDARSTSTRSLRFCLNKTGIIDLRYFPDSKKLGWLEDQELDFCRHWNISAAISPSIERLPAKVRFIEGNLFMKRVLLRAATDGAAARYDGFLQGRLNNDREDNREGILILLRNGPTLEKDLTLIRQAVRKLPECANKKLVTTDRSDLNRMLRAFDFRSDGLSIRKIAEKMRHEFDGGKRGADDFKGSVDNAIARAETLIHAAPNLEFRPKIISGKTA